MKHLNEVLVTPKNKSKFKSLKDVQHGGIYWENKGVYQKELDEYSDKLIPLRGKAKTEAGELLRCATAIYHDAYNNFCGNMFDPLYITETNTYVNDDGEEEVEEEEVYDGCELKEDWDKENFKPLEKAFSKFGDSVTMYKVYNLCEELFDNEMNDLSSSSKKTFDKLEKYLNDMIDNVVYMIINDMVKM